MQHEMSDHLRKSLDEYIQKLPDEQPETEREPTPAENAAEYAMTKALHWLEVSPPNLYQNSERAKAALRNGLAELREARKIEQSEVEEEEPFETA